MAFKLNLDLSNQSGLIKAVIGVTTPSAKLYGRIYSPVIDDTKSSIHIQLVWYELQQNCKVVEECLIPTLRLGVLSNNYSFPFDINNSDDLFKQGYNYLKTLPEFEGCEDC